MAEPAETGGDTPPRAAKAPQSWDTPPNHPKGTHHSGRPALGTAPNNIKGAPRQGHTTQIGQTLGTAIEGHKAGTHHSGAPAAAWNQRAWNQRGHTTF
ncbi:hypothetical protein LBMAG46_33140 [Planctomycetia bacterium]|nr:hypothetical protein LBMAG46_33140 [Planctomycetia bacterium]